MGRTGNPFRFEGPIPAADLLGRDAERDALVQHALDRRVVSLAAPRRYGKTSLLRAAAEELTSTYGFLVVHVDLLALTGVDDLVARYATAWRRATQEDRKVRRAFDSLLGGLAGFGVTVLGTGVSFTRRERGERGDADALTVAHALLDLPGTVDAPVLVVLDEFQALHPVWPQGEGVLRSHTQSPEQANRVAYAFAGSEPTLLAAAFADHGRAYYQQVLQVPVGRLADADLAAGISARFHAADREVGGALAPLIALAAGHPQRAMLLAHLLFERTPRGGRADAAWPEALRAARVWVADEVTAIWESLTPVQRAALRAVAETGSAVRAGAGGGAAARSSRQSAVAALRARGLVEADERPGPRGGERLRLVDPMLADWLTRTAVAG